MEDLIESLTARLEKVNKLVASKQKTDEITSDDIIVIASFFNDFQETNHLIDFAERLAHSNIDTLRKEVLKLDEQITAYLSIDTTSLQEEIGTIALTATNLLVHKLKEITEAILRNIDSLKIERHE